MHILHKAEVAVGEELVPPFSCTVGEVHLQLEKNAR